jgi:hypothetical protein
MTEDVVSREFLWEVLDELFKANMIYVSGHNNDVIHRLEPMVTEAPAN